MALGAGLVTPLQMAGGFSVLANGGYRINPYLIAEVTDQRRTMVAHAQPLVAAQSAPHAIEPLNAYVMNSLLQSVAQRGTGAKTNVRKRTDLDGKSGATNDSRDAWFAGYQHTLTAIAWIGYDNPRSLGDKETGGGLALPVWIEYMACALKGAPQYKMPIPDDVTELGSELYFDDFTPRHGFVAKVRYQPSGARCASEWLSVRGTARTGRRTGKAGHHESVPRALAPVAPGLCSEGVL